MAHHLSLTVTAHSIQFNGANGMKYSLVGPINVTMHQESSSGTCNIDVVFREELAPATLKAAAPPCHSTSLQSEAAAPTAAAGMRQDLGDRITCSAPAPVCSLLMSEWPISKSFRLCESILCLVF